MYTRRRNTALGREFGKSGS